MGVILTSPHKFEHQKSFLNRINISTGWRVFGQKAAKRLAERRKWQTASLPGKRQIKVEKRKQMNRNFTYSLFAIFMYYTTTAGSNQLQTFQFDMSVMFIPDWQFFTRSCPFKRSSNHQKEELCIQAGRATYGLSDKRQDVFFPVQNAPTHVPFTPGEAVRPGGAPNDTCCPMSVHLSSY